MRRKEGDSGKGTLPSMKPEKKNDTNAPIATWGTMPPSDCLSMPVTASGLVIMASWADRVAGFCHSRPPGWE